MPECEDQRLTAVSRATDSPTTDRHTPSRRTRAVEVLFYPDGVKSRTRKLLDAMIEEATVDCYNDSERATGFYTMLAEHLAVPFQARFRDFELDVIGVDLSENDQIMAICVGGGVRHSNSILDLTLPAPPPAGAEWIDAYRRWHG